ncbi:GNAT family N-acetyltransferase [Actinomadura alba]|uniref:GNAT family N-acetyltransferase n=1 Tax=Actinomadura alba TaxID=406431 RepID=UPI0031D948F4
MTADFTVRRPQPADAPALAELRWAFKREDDEGPPHGAVLPTGEAERWIRDRLGGGRWLARVAEADGEIRGHVFLHLVERMPDPYGESAPIGYTTNFYVMPGRRNQGIGSALLQALDEYARRMALDTLIVWPGERSASLYRRSGCHTPGELLELPLGT